VAAPRPPEAGDFPDLLALRQDGAVTGLFSDHGSWLAATWGEGVLLELHDTLNERRHGFDLGAPARLRAVWMDRLEASLANGAELRIGFAGDGLMVVDYDHEEPPEVACELRWTVQRLAEDRWRVLLGDAADAPRDDFFAINRRRWDQRLAAAFAGFRGEGDRDRLLLARAVATLQWNRRAAVRGLPDEGVVPSPFAYRGFWGWDSWKHAHALARFDPALGLAQLRAQFFGEDADAMVPDTVMPEPSANNRLNTKPPMAAWALDALRRAGVPEAEGLEDGTDPLAALRERCVGQLRWWARNRRATGEAMYRHGGVDRCTAMWDSGWDDSLRFAGARLRPHGDWQLIGLYQPDLHAYLQVDFGAMARLYQAAGLDEGAWLEREGQMAKLMQNRLWDRERGAFCDHDLQGRSTGVLSAACWLPVWSGAARSKQAAAVRGLLREPAHFDTPMPFPSLAASEPGFDPDGYWNGGVWLDHAAMALVVLDRGGEGDRGAGARERLLDAVAAYPGFAECYSPLTGAPCHGERPAVPQFSWSAAAVLELLTGGPVPAPVSSS